MAFKIGGPANGPKPPSPVVSPTSGARFVPSIGKPVVAGPSRPGFATPVSKPVAPQSLAINSRPPMARPPLPIKAAAPAVAKQATRTGSQWLGRREAPPPTGSSYRDYLEWAADGRMPMQEDEAIALDYFMGMRHDEMGDEAPPLNVTIKLGF